MSLLPSRSDRPATDEADPRVVGVESEDADELLSALSSETARRILAALHEDPAPPGELADRIDTSLQNAQYHLENLQAAGAVQVVDTAYSEKGREMDVYAPADQPLVIFAGDRDTSSNIRMALTRLLGGLGILAMASVLIQQLVGDGLGIGPLLDGGGGGPATPTPRPTPTPSSAEGGTPSGLATETPARAADVADAAAGLPPGLVFFLGGATVLLVGFLAWYVEL